jgi:hypothetical protein
MSDELENALNNLPLVTKEEGLRNRTGQPTPSSESDKEYTQGFYDAQDGAPIWVEQCSPSYAAGWRAFWNLKNASLTPKP